MARHLAPFSWRQTMAEIVRRRSFGAVLPLGRQASISGSSLIQCASVSIALSSFQEGQNARHQIRFKLEQALEAGRLTIQDAGERMGLRRRQVFRLVKAFRQRGAASLVSRQRGRLSNNRLPKAVRDLAMAIVTERYADFGPTLAAEKLAEVHGCRVSRETLRQWMIEDGLWLDRRRRLPSVHQPRNRRERV